MASASSNKSARIKEQRRIIDEAARQRRARKALENLENDNFHEDPHADLVMSKKALSLFQDDEGPTEILKKEKRKTRKEEYYKIRYRKNFSQLLEEDSGSDSPNYLNAQVPPSNNPIRRFCAVCGDFFKYTCVSCGAYYCSLRCQDTHQETRCLKWTS